MMHYFHESWRKQKNILLLNVTNDAVLDFFVKKCGVQTKKRANGTSIAVKTITNKLSDLHNGTVLLKNTEEIMKIEDAIKKIAKNNT